MWNGVITFRSTYDALRCQKTLGRFKIECKMGPTPRDLSATCALAIYFYAHQIQMIQDAIKEKKLGYEGVFVEKDNMSWVEVQG